MCNDACRNLECIQDSECTDPGLCVEGICQLCGNGKVDDGEECDSVEGYTDGCVVEEGYSCEPS